MHRNRSVRTTLGGWLVAVAVVAAAAPAGSAAASPGGSAAASPGGSAASPGASTAASPGGSATSPVPAALRTGQAFRTVTLITGDRLKVAADGISNVSIEAGPGRSGVGFIRRVVGGHLHVIPTDALPLLHAGRLDPRLFDITTLLAFGYDDSRRAELPLIVTGGARSSAPSARAASGVTGVRVVRELPAVNGLAVRQSRKDPAALWAGLAAPGAAAGAARTLAGQVGKVWLDGLRRPNLDGSVPMIGAPTAWAAGYTGAGVPVAVVDSGIDAAHPDLAGRVVAARDFSAEADGVDHVGHGTHVASTLTGSGAASGGKYRGVAPGVKLYDAKVCGLADCQESSIVAGMTWAAAEQHAKVVNISLGGDDTADLDPLEEAVRNLTAAHGTLFVIAAGNGGRDQSIGSPGSADGALTVGAVTNTDELADFSSRGPRFGDAALKPDITAPGQDITAARSKDGLFGTKGEPYLTMSGTSMAAPHVAGAAAILAQQHPDWTPAKLKSALMGSARPSPTIGVFAQGAGRVDVARAIRQTVTASPASVSFGRQLWPHADDRVLTSTVTYHNDSAAAVTLNLALRHTGSDGRPVPDGPFTIGASTITVPAGGDAGVTVTADTRRAGPDGYAGAFLTATAGDVVVQTPLAVDKEVESYDLTFTHRNRAGSAPADYDTILIGLDADRLIRAYDPSGTVNVRVPKGRYAVASVIVDEPEAERPKFSLLAQPVLDVARAQTVDIDARVAKSSSVTVARRDATQVMATLGFDMGGSASGFNGGLASDSFDNLFSGQIGDSSRPVDGFTSNIGAQFGKVDADGELVNSPYAYSLAWYERGRMLSGVRRSVVDRDLAAVRVTLAQATPGASGERAMSSAPPDGMGSGISAAFRYDLPSSHIEFYNTDDGVRWAGRFVETVPSQDPEVPFPTPIALTESLPTRYEPGRHHAETWNQGVFGPVLPARPVPALWATRVRDHMILLTPLHGDGAGRPGYSSFDTANITVARNGTTVAEGEEPSGIFPVPAEAGRYRVAVEATRGAPFVLSTRVQAAWTFRSGHVAGDVPRALPLSVIRFTPRLDLHNTAPRERVLRIPIEVQRQPDSAAGRLRSLRAEVSFDDGRTWRVLRVDRSAAGGVGTVRYPRGEGAVSLRASATDSAGNTVEQTIIRAFRYGG